MNKEYVQMTQRVIDHITQLDRSTTTQKLYRRCFNLFGDYMSERTTDYSPEVSKAWLSSPDVSKANFSIFSAAINKLNEWLDHIDDLKRKFGL